jgi:hypothetical protein
MLRGVTNREFHPLVNMIGKGGESIPNMAHMREVELTQATARVQIEKLVRKDMQSHAAALNCI